MRALSTGAASTQRQARSHRAPAVPVPKPAPKLPQPIPTQPRLSRKSVDCILEETGGYERDQYRPTAPILDAEARRREEQLLAEHGRKGLAAMRRLEAEQAAAKRRQRDNPAATPQPDLATQVRQKHTPGRLAARTQEPVAIAWRGDLHTRSPIAVRQASRCRARFSSPADTASHARAAGERAGRAGAVRGAYGGCTARRRRSAQSQA